MWQTGSIIASSKSKMLVTMVVLLPRVCGFACINTLDWCRNI
jgi:hypothetical protein